MTDPVVMAAAGLFVLATAAFVFATVRWKRGLIGDARFKGFTYAYAATLITCVVPLLHNRVVELGLLGVGVALTIVSYMSSKSISNRAAIGGIAIFVAVGVLSIVLINRLLIAR
jgi:hypothetical protein